MVKFDATEWVGGPARVTAAGGGSTLARLVVSPRSLVVRPSTTVALTCARQPAGGGGGGGGALSGVRWELEGRELERARGHVTLVIGGFDEASDGGVYRCSAETAGGGRAVSDHATLYAAGTRPTLPATA